MAQRLARISTLLDSAQDAYDCGSNDAALVLLPLLAGSCRTGVLT
jgi:tRNA A22 N-methylase